MNIEPKYLELTLETSGIRDSQKRLKSLIEDFAVTPLKKHQEDLSDQFELVEEIVRKRVAAVIAHWCQHKHSPVAPSSRDYMSEITNATKNDVTLEEFYVSEVKQSLYTLAPILNFSVPDTYTPKTDELEFVLLELEESGVSKKEDSPFSRDKKRSKYDDDFDDEDEYNEDGLYNEDDLYDEDDLEKDDLEKDDFAEDDDTDDDVEEERESLRIPVLELQPQRTTMNRRVEKEPVRVEVEIPVYEAVPVEEPRRETAIVQAPAATIQDVETAPTQVATLNISTEQAWTLIYGLIGYTSEYIQQTMLPRWQQHPDTFEQDRRFLYSLFIDTIRNASGTQSIAGNMLFSDQRASLDQMWNHYFSDLSRNVGPQLSAARMYTTVNAPWHVKLRKALLGQLKNVSPVWLLALAIAMFFDGLTTYISLDQTPMEGPIVIVFSVLITALFQIADQLVISYRKREFEADALTAKFKAQHERLSKSLAGLETSSESYVNLSMEKSKAHADWKAAEDNRKMAKRGRFWTARIADINVIVTAYGFSFLFLNSSEPLYAVVQQVDFIFVKGQWEQVDLWVFLMVALAVTVSFVVNTAQRTEILGWSMRRLKNETGATR
ncbi:MAG: hypothetical protein SF029_02570 [bacterium]|nr:hypothetical protein [bacterium]